MTGQFGHIPVMPREAAEYLGLKPGGVAVDCTLGLGGHALLMAAAIGVTGRLIALDQDVDAIGLARVRLEGFGGRLDILKSNFARVDAALQGLGVSGGVDAILFDLGVSSLQLDTPERGFSFRVDAPLDMRMDIDGSVTAFDLINTLPEKELADLQKKFVKFVFVKM